MVTITKQTFNVKNDAIKIGFKDVFQTQSHLTDIKQRHRMTSVPLNSNKAHSVPTSSCPSRDIQ